MIIDIQVDIYIALTTPPRRRSHLVPNYSAAIEDLLNMSEKVNHFIDRTNETSFVQEGKITIKRATKLPRELAIKRIWRQDKVFKYKYMVFSAKVKTNIYNLYSEEELIPNGIGDGALPASAPQLNTSTQGIGALWSCRVVELCLCGAIK